MSLGSFHQEEEDERPLQPTTKQQEAIQFLWTRLERPGDVPKPTTMAEAALLIEALSEERQERTRNHRQQHQRRRDQRSRGDDLTVRREVRSSTIGPQQPTQMRIRTAVTDWRCDVEQAARRGFLKIQQSVYIDQGLAAGVTDPKSRDRRDHRKGPSGEGSHDCGKSPGFPRQSRSPTVKASCRDKENPERGWKAPLLEESERGRKAPLLNSACPSFVNSKVAYQTAASSPGPVRDKWSVAGNPVAMPVQNADAHPKHHRRGRGSGRAGQRRTRHHDDRLTLIVVPRGSRQGRRSRIGVVSGCGQLLDEELPYLLNARVEGVAGEELVRVARVQRLGCLMLGDIEEFGERIRAGGDMDAAGARRGVAYIRNRP